MIFAREYVEFTEILYKQCFSCPCNLPHYSHVLTVHTYHAGTTQYPKFVLCMSGEDWANSEIVGCISESSGTL
jgi:hypothetical protein